MEKGSFASHAANGETGEAEGLVPLLALVSNRTAPNVTKPPVGRLRGKAERLRPRLGYDP
jgi:hypothetical protein